MKTFVHDIDVRREGIELGKELGIEVGRELGVLLSKISLVCRKLRKGKPVEVIAEELEEDVARISDICEVAKAYAPDYDEEKVCEAYLNIK